MYSPKISEKLIPDLYKIGIEKKKPMTKVVDEIISSYLHIYKNFSEISPTAVKSILENVLNGDDGED